MFRSMLYVRNGSGCSLRVTASAASPSATRSCDSMRRTPSSNDRRSPATAFSSSGVIAEDKLEPSRGQIVFDGQFVKAAKPLPLGRSQSVIQVLRQIVEGRLRRQIE